MWIGNNKRIWTDGRYYMKKEIRYDLIEKELHDKHSFHKDFKFRKFKLNKKFIDKLMNHYYCTELTEHYYDSEPKFEDIYDGISLYDMDYDYNYNVSDPWNLDKYKHLNLTKQDFVDAHYKVKKAYKDYREQRMLFNNWIEVFAEGIWGMNQQNVDDYCRESLKMNAKDFNTKDRCYIAKENDMIAIYLYGRDIFMQDYWVLLKKRKHRLK